MEPDKDSIITEITHTTYRPNGIRSRLELRCSDEYRRIIFTRDGFSTAHLDLEEAKAVGKALISLAEQGRET